MGFQNQDLKKSGKRNQIWDERHCLVTTQAGGKKTDSVWAGHKDNPPALQLILRCHRKKINVE